jgi:NAD(P) transhydrogenase subunit beta
MNAELQTAAYIAATVLFILSLGGLKDQESAKRGVWFGIVGMAIAVLATIFGPINPHDISLGTVLAASPIVLLVAVVIGAVIGSVVAKRVEMTGMPQLVAMLHSFVGLAAVFIGLNSDLTTHAFPTPAEEVIHEIEVFLGVFIGAVTFTGSLIAYGKLSGRIGGKAMLLPGRHLLNILMVVVSFILLIMYMNGLGSWTLYLMTLIAFVIGVHMVMAIGGADMPVVVSMLNSCSATTC